MRRRSNLDGQCDKSEGFKRSARSQVWRPTGAILVLLMISLRAEDASPALVGSGTNAATNVTKPASAKAEGAQPKSPATASASPKTPGTTAATPPTLPVTTVNTEAADDSLYKNMSLQQLMDQDVTSVSKEPQPYSEAPAAIDVITNDEIRRSGASNLPEALRLADNLDVAQDNSHDWNISARGFNSGLANKLLVLDDGRTIYSPLFSGVIWDAQGEMLHDVDRIEVISGPGGTLWGANAVNGVINIVTKSAQDTQGWYTEAGGGDQLRDFGAVRYGGTLAPNVYFRVWGMYSDNNGEVLSDGSPANDAWSQGRGGFRIDTDAKADDKFTVQGEYYNGASGHDPSIGTDTQSGGNVLGRWTHTFSSDSEADLQVYYDRTDFSEPVADFSIFEPAGFFSDHLDTADIAFHHTFKIDEANQFSWGLGYRFTHDVDDNAPTLVVMPATLDQSLYNGYVQDEAHLTRNVTLTFGSKLEHNDYTGFEYEPSGRVKWDITDKQMVWAAVSRAVRMPSRLDENLVEPTGLPNGLPQSLLTGNTEFQSEKLIAYELGYRAQLLPQVTMSLSGFYNDYTRIRSITPTTGGFLDLPLVFHNNLEGYTYGFELSTDYQVNDWWRLHAGYDFLKEDIHVVPGEIDFTHGLNETADPENQVFLRSSMDLSKDIDFDLGGRFIDSLTINDGATAATVPGYFELDARLAWRVTQNVELSVVGQNLLHDQHAEYGFPGPDQVQIERSVYGKVTWSF